MDALMHPPTNRPGILARRHDHRVRHAREGRGGLGRAGERREAGSLQALPHLVQQRRLAAE
jgi:hypothetical protein